MAAEIIALVTAGVVYWLTIYPRARLEIRRWVVRAGQIPDPTLRAQALYKLTRERLNPEAATFFAVLAPRRHRSTLVRLMVCFQIAYDYLDAINEERPTAALRNGLQLHRALSDAVSSHAPGGDYYRYHPQHEDGGYLVDLVRACQDALQALPSASAIESLLVHAAERCGEAQSRNHAVLVEGNGQLIDWAASQREKDEYLWWELAAAGISCLALHALFAAAARATTLEEAARIDMAYFPSVCAISALLDSLVDRPDDSVGTNHSFVAHYEKLDARGPALRGHHQRSSHALERAQMPPPPWGDPLRHRQLLPLSPRGEHRARPACRDAYARLSRTIQRADSGGDAPAPSERRLSAGTRRRCVSQAQPNRGCSFTGGADTCGSRAPARAARRRRASSCSDASCSGSVPAAARLRRRRVPPRRR